MPLSLSDVELVDGIAIYRIAGHCRLVAAANVVTRAIDQAIRGRHALCLIDGLGVCGFDPPSVAFRHQMIREWAKTADGRVSCALVVRPELIDRERFAVVAGRNFGFTSEVFNARSEALAWLRDQRAPGWAP